MSTEAIINAVKNQDYLEFSELVNAELDRRAEEAIASRVSEVYRSEPEEDEEYEQAEEHEGYEDEEVQEEAEPLDELSKGTLSRYIQKAGPQASNASEIGNWHRKKAERTGVGSYFGKDFDKLAAKRIKGMAAASKRIVKEVAEPEPEGEKDFVAKHKTELKNPARYPEHQFKATTKKDKTKKASYEDGADEEAYS